VGHQSFAAVNKLLPTTLVGSYPQPEWLIDRAKLAGRFPPRVRAKELWRIAEPFLEEAQNDATLLAIRAQEQAFGRDDAAAAYSHAAPEIKQLFPQADIFLQMVQQAYQPVYRHKSFEFGEARAANGRIAQRVHIVDANGEAWEAMYTLEQQADGSLKITGCSLLKAGQAV